MGLLLSRLVLFVEGMFDGVALVFIWVAILRAEERVNRSVW